MPVFSVDGREDVGGWKCQIFKMEGRFHTQQGAGIIVTVCLWTQTRCQYQRFPQIMLSWWLCIFFLVVLTMEGPQARDEFFSLKLSTSEKRPDLAWLTVPAYLADRSTSSYCDVPSPFLAHLVSSWTPQSTHPSNLNFCSELVIKTRRPVTEVSCLGYRRAAWVKGHVGLCRIKMRERGWELHSYRICLFIWLVEE